MYIKSLAVIFCALQCLVFALPLVPFGGDIAPREYDAKIAYRSLYRCNGGEGASTSTSGGVGPIRNTRQRFKGGVNAVIATKRVQKPVPHELSLKQSNVGTPQEHWALHFHPTEPNGQDHLHVVHAVSSPGKGGVLETEHIDTGAYNPPANSANPPTHIASFPSKKAADSARRDIMKNVRLTQPFPTQNCVDFTCNAVNRLASKNKIQPQEAAAFQQYYDTHKDAVRQTTDTQHNRDAAGVPK